MKQMKKQLLELLNIKAVSGKEKPVRDYLKPVLNDLMDTVKVDNYGNLLAEKKCGTGIGSTILLSAHMDTVRGVLEDSVVIEESEGVFKANKGALGADDRAGIAIILTVLRNVDKLNFNGVIKVAFSREEEVGCVGSSKIDKNWYEDTDLAIVVDRRGNRDVVVGCGMAFCCDEVGKFFEDASALQGMDWKAVEGGISDAMTFAENGVNSVNLSAGYRHEHTDREFVVLSDMEDTVKLIMQVLAVVNDHAYKFQEVPYENKWVKSWNKSKYQYSYSSYYEDCFDGYDEGVYAEEFDKHGDVFIYEVGKDVVIQQGNTEIFLSRDSLKSLVSQLS